ncbi:hypothetical protein BRADI_3g34431v3 [Brachypodium distachyon]|uniref:Uncharacterized protein n=1 Tax=Brachypodium distachyon TaxID=15368 RepID=A0A0Q3JII3_BRADI|nr:hypothetical protein BRADI_3g34431v3 [Brachypodium distachyon]
MKGTVPARVHLHVASTSTTCPHVRTTTTTSECSSSSVPDSSTQYFRLLSSTQALRDYTHPGMALNPLVVESSPSVTPGRVGYSIDQQSLATDEPSSQVGATLSSTTAPPLLDPTPRTPLGSPPVIPAPPSPDYTPASPEYTPTSPDYTPASPDYNPGLADAVLTYSDLAELDTSLVSSQFTPSDFLRVPSDITPSEHPLSSVPDSTAHESDAAAPRSPPPAPSVFQSAPTTGLDPDLLFTHCASPLVRED